MTINDRIKKIRLENKLSQTEMAKRIGITQGAISEIESGKSKPTIDTVISICKKFVEIDPKWLLLGNNYIEKSDNPMTYKELEEKIYERAENTELSKEEFEEVLSKTIEIYKIMKKEQ